MSETSEGRFAMPYVKVLLEVGVTSIYLQGIDSAEIIDAVHSRPAPVISATAGLTPSL